MSGQPAAGRAEGAAVRPPEARECAGSSGLTGCSGPAGCSAQPAARSPQAAIPPVHQVVAGLADLGLPQRLCADLVRRELDAVRAAAPVPARAAITSRVRAAAERLAAARLRPVINATGVLLHTNLGRAPLGAALAALPQVAGAYTNLELDLTTGERGSRGHYVEQALAALCRAPAATVVNNCAAALLLTVAAARGAAAPDAPERTEVVVSRGELIRIGGGFRIPDLLTAAGARLREVGTTNHTTADDYAAACGERTAALLSVHRSNFVMRGFVATPRLAELRDAAASAGVPLIVDLGSGAVTPTDAGTGLPREPLPQEALAGGATLVCFSGDKLFGGPQAGVAAGAAEWIARLKRHPLFRALRLDKIALALLQQTLDTHLDHGPAVPLQELMRTPVAGLQRRAAALAGRLPATLRAAPNACASRLGGGTMPTGTLPSAGIALRPAAAPHGAEALAAALRGTDPPVIGYLRRDQLVLDLRTVLPSQDAALARALEQGAAALPSAPA